MVKLINYLAGTTAKTVIVATLLILAVGYLDYLAWDEAAFSFFYLLPILFVTRRLNLISGIVVSVICAIVLFLNDSYLTKHYYGNQIALYWNTLISFAFFILFVFMIEQRKKAGKAREEMQEKMYQSQRMESVGRLAGGVAHDFNNLLTGITVYSGFVLSGLAKDDPLQEDVKEILNAAERAAMLTKQLLAFSRKQILNPQVVDLNVAVVDIIKLLKRIIGENIQLETKLAAQACPVKVDIGQISQVIINLAVNARDAMPNGGILSLELGLVTHETKKALINGPKLPHRPMVYLVVRDNGCGMTDATKEHIFEPFFTTKEKGKGTGLGLSTVFGIVEQSGGEISVVSEPNKGTSFQICFPYIDTPIPDKGKDKEKSLPGSETVLLVEDDESLRRMGERILRTGGYTVITAADGKEAIKAAERYGRPVDLLVTDVVMPGMNGRELAQELDRRKMIRRTLYMSGYTDDAIVKHGVLDPGIAFIYKPFTTEAFSIKLREVLDGPGDKAKA